MKPILAVITLMLSMMITLACIAAPTLTTPATTNVGANMATLALQSSETGTGYFTVRSGSNANCGDGGKVAFGTFSSYHGSLPLTANAVGSYTVRNLTHNSSYTVCFTADSPSGSNLNSNPLFANISTNAAKTLTNSGWSAAGNPGFSVGEAYYSSLAFAPDGTPYVAYQDGSNSGKATVMKLTDNVWSAAGVAGFSTGTASYTSLAFAPDGTPYVAFGGDEFNPSKATVMKYSDSSWSVVGDPENPGFSADTAAFTSLAFAPDGTPHIAYSDYSNGYKTTVMKFNGSIWIPVGDPGFSAGDVYYTSLAFAPDGTPYVAYQDGGNGSKTTVMKYTAGAWSAVGDTGFSNGMASSTSLAIASDGTPYVAYQDGGNGSKATVMQYSAGAWAPVKIAGFTAGGADYPSLAIAPDGNPYVAYQDWNNGYKVTVMKFSGGAWSVVGTAGFSGPANSTSLAFAPDGGPYVAYGDDGNGSKATLMNLVNLAPTISGTPPEAASLGIDYIFTPAATDADRFTVSSKLPLPSWLSFSESSGALSGNPDATGIIEDIVITAINDAGSASLPVFSITVTDITVPETAITLFPANPTFSTSFSFNFTATPSSGASFECSLNGGAFAPCSNPYLDNFSYTSCSTCRTETARNLAVKAKNQAGTDNTPDSYAWTINHLLGTPFDYVNGGGEVQLRAITHSGDLNINRPGIAFSLKGGYNPEYTSNSGLTSIQGTFTILYGTVTIENIVIM